MLTDLGPCINGGTGLSSGAVGIGESGDTTHMIEFGDGEYITGVIVRYYARVDRHTLFTNTNPTGYGPYGGLGGKEDRHNIKVKSLCGYQKEYLRSIGFYYEP